MDFLEIRRKAKERAAERAAPATPPAGEDPGPPAAGDGEAAAGPSGLAAETVGLALTPLPDVVPPDLELREPPRPESPLTPAPRWPAMVDGGALVEALREELGAGPTAPAAPLASLLPEEPSRLHAPPASGPSLPEAFPPPTTSAALAGAAAPGPDAEPSEPDPLADFFFDEAELVPALEGIPAAVPAPAAEAEARREYLTFLLGAEEYAVEIERVREVLKVPAITEVPRAPAHVLGVVMVRGEVVAVFDPRRRLGLPAATVLGRAGRVLVCDAGEGAVGLLVDAVSQVMRLRPADVEPRPQGIGGAAAEYIAGIGRDRGRMVILLDLGAVLGARAAEARA
jgi:purine-binding chemotaxis protein CheW